jgi:hypothetical protein
LQQVRNFLVARRLDVPFTAGNTTWLLLFTLAWLTTES